MDRLKLGGRDKLFIVEGEDGVTPIDPLFRKVVEAYDDLSNRYRNALRELAK